jgi:hypothetical protein
MEIKPTKNSMTTEDINLSPNVADLNLEQFKYVCSLGSLCHTAQIMKINNLKKCSYPFDWIFFTYNNVIDSIEDDFTKFLDKSQYIDKSYDKCGHLTYGDIMFNHHNPLSNIDHYNYYERCVGRFRNLLQKTDNKLFIMFIPNLVTVDKTIKKDIIKFNDRFSKYTTNYTLLVILHMPNKPENYHLITRKGNIDFLELHTLTESGGVKFGNITDDNYLNDIINTLYNFAV